MNCFVYNDIQNAQSLLFQNVVEIMRKWTSRQKENKMNFAHSDFLVHPHTGVLQNLFEKKSFEAWHDRVIDPEYGNELAKFE